jgi:hypothetical protein
MENVVRRLFDFQRFERNADLQRIIDDVHTRYTMKELGLDDLTMVAAAGVPAAGRQKDPEEHRG